MDIKKAAKKIVALGGSSAMVAMSLTGALAYDLADYPQEFIEDGQFDGKIVVGENAATEDLLGALDIATHLQQASTDGDTGGSSGSMSGDSLQIEESSDILELGEQIGSVINTLTDDDLEILMDGRITTEGSTDYTQIIELDGIPAGSGLVKLDQNDDDDVGFYLFYDNGAQLFNYELEFTSGLDSDVEDNVLDDLEDETITMLGKQFSVVNSRVEDTDDDLVLELIAGDVVDTLEQGQTRTYEVMNEDGDLIDYEITLLAVGSSGSGQARFLVNGESTDSIEEGETERLGSGLEIGVRDILVLDRNFEGDQGSIVEFYLGANKLEIGPVDSGVASTNVEYNDEDLDDVTVTVSYTADVTSGDGDITISQIAWAVEADDEFYLGEGESLRDYMEEPEALISEDLDFMFGGLSEPQIYEIGFEPQSDDEYSVSFFNRRGDEYDVPYYHADSTDLDQATLGEEGSGGDNFHFFEVFTDDGDNVTVASTFVIEEDGYFVVTDDQGTADEDADSYVLQFIDVDEDDSTVTFRDVSEGSNDDIEAQIEGTVFSGVVPVADFFNAANITGELRIGGQDYSFWLYDAGDDQDDYTLVVDQNGDDDVAGVDSASTDTTVEPINIVTRGGGIMTLGNSSQIEAALDGTDTDRFTMTLTTVADDVDSDVIQENALNFTASGGEVDFGSLVSNSGILQSADFDDSDRTWYVNAYGTMFDILEDDEDADELTVLYPATQREALVYVTGGVVEGRQSMASSGSGVNVNPVDLGLGVLDADVSVGEDNLIVVGGPCANSIAAELLGNPSDCAEGFEPNMGMIQGFDTGSNVAVLVAGFSAEDTIRTSQVLASATVGDEDLEGEAVEVSFPTSSTSVVRSMDMMDDMDDDESDIVVADDE